MPLFEEYCEEVRDLWESRWLTNCGSKHERLRTALSEYLGVECVDLFVNGHSALECAFEALELGADGRDEVITTPFTFASTVNAIVRKGLKPVFCDIKPDDYTIDPNRIVSLVTNRTCAIAPVHVYGNPCDVSAIQDIASRYNLKVIYDAAHAFGVELEGRGIGSYGDAAMFSFHATKVFNTVEGGALTHGDPSLSERLAQWRNFGLAGEDAEFVGGNAKMNEFCAAMGLCNLRHIDGEIAKRKMVAELYWELLTNIPGIKLSLPKPGVKPNYSYLPVIFNEEVFGTTRDEVASALSGIGVFARKYFYPAVNEFSSMRELGSAETPIAAELSRKVLTLPLYAGLEDEDVRRICEVVISCKR